MKTYKIEGGFGKEGYDLNTYPIKKYKPVHNMGITCAQHVKKVGIRMTISKDINNSSTFKAQAVHI